MYNLQFTCTYLFPWTINSTYHPTKNAVHSQHRGEGGGGGQGFYPDLVANCCKIVANCVTNINLPGEVLLSASLLCAKCLRNGTFLLEVEIYLQQKTTHDFILISTLPLRKKKKGKKYDLIYIHIHHHPLPVYWCGSVKGLIEILLTLLNKTTSIFIANVKS